MLTKEQLEDLSKCDINRDCGSCSLNEICMDSTEEAAQTALVYMKENEQLRDAVKGSLVIVTAAQDKVKKYEETLKKAKGILEPLRKLAVLVMNEKNFKNETTGAEVAKEYAERAKQLITVIDEVMKG
jgi:hypothetical protein